MKLERGRDPRAPAAAALTKAKCAPNARARGLSCGERAADRRIAAAAAAAHSGAPLDATRPSRRRKPFGAVDGAREAARERLCDVGRVVVKEEDLVVDAIAKNNSAVFSITKESQDADGKTIEVSAGQR